jgi:hypothetical protein
MAEKRKPLPEELGIPLYGQLMGLATGTDEDQYDAAYISREFSKEAKLDDNDRTEDSLRHILLGGLVYGDDSEESLLGQAGRGIAGKIADWRESDSPESLVDLNNNAYGRKLREMYPDREEFIAKAKEIAQALYTDGELPEVDGLAPKKSYGRFETPERLQEFEEEEAKRIYTKGPDGNWILKEDLKKAEMAEGGLMKEYDTSPEEKIYLDEAPQEEESSFLEDLYKKIPANVRLYGEFMAGKEDPITEKDFSKEELQAMREAISKRKKENQQVENFVRSFAEDNQVFKKKSRLEYDENTGKLKEREYYVNYKMEEFSPEDITDPDILKTEQERLKTAIESFDKTAGKTSVNKYYDRDVYQPGLMGTLEKLGDPRYGLQTSLGEFTATENDDGTISISDDYNFNPDEFDREDIDLEMLIANADNPQHLAELLARKFRPEHSREVDITMSKEDTPEMNKGGLMLAAGADVAKGVATAVAKKLGKDKKKTAIAGLSPTAVALGMTIAPEDAEAAYVPLSALKKGTQIAQDHYKEIKKLLDEGVDAAPNGELYQRTGAYKDPNGEIKVDLPELKARDLQMAKAVGQFTEDAKFFVNNTKKTTRVVNKKMSDYLPENSPIFEYFPELKDAKVTLRRAKYSSNENYTYGYYSPYDKEIVLLFRTKADTGKVNLDDPVKAFNTLVHEFQHHIQDVKKATGKGFNTARTFSTIKKMKEDYQAALKKIQQNPDNVDAQNYVKQVDMVLDDAGMNREKFLSTPDNKLGRLQYPIYVRELGEMEARSSGRKALLAGEDPERKKLGVFYPASSEDPGRLIAGEISMEKSFPESQAMVRIAPDSWDETLTFVKNAEKAVDAGEQGVSNATKAAGTAGTVAGIASMPSEAFVGSLGFEDPTPSPSLIADERLEDIPMEQQVMLDFLTPKTKPYDLISSIPGVDLTFMASDAMKWLGDQTKPEGLVTEAPESVDEFSDMPVEFNTGGLLGNEYNPVAFQGGTGIPTEAGLDMANQNFVLDRQQADLDNNGLISPYEEIKGEASQRSVAQMNKGGMMGDPFAPLNVIIGIEEESGNEIPAGSKPEEVKDDIPALLSEGEYVVPADVVRWHGLKHFEAMRCEAKQALGMMAQHDRIAYVDDDEEEEHEMSESPEMEMKEDMEDPNVPSEDVKVEKPVTKVIKAADGVAVAPSVENAPTFYRYISRLNPTTNRYEFVPVDPTTGQVVTPEAFQAERSTRYTPANLLSLTADVPECPDGYEYDEEVGACVPVEVTPTPAVTAPAIGGGDGPQTEAVRVDYVNQPLTKLADLLGPLSAEDLSGVKGATLSDKAITRMTTPATPVSLASPIISGIRNIYDDVGARRAALTREAELNRMIGEEGTTVNGVTTYDKPIAAYNWNWNPQTGSFNKSAVSSAITETQKTSVGTSWVTDFNHVGATGKEYTEADLGSYDSNGNFSWDNAVADDIMDQIENELAGITAVSGGPQYDGGGDGGSTSTNTSGMSTTTSGDDQAGDDWGGGNDSGSSSSSSSSDSFGGGRDDDGWGE